MGWSISSATINLVLREKAVKKELSQDLHILAALLISITHLIQTLGPLEWIILMIMSLALRDGNLLFSMRINISVCKTYPVNKIMSSLDKITNFKDKGCMTIKTSMTKCRGPLVPFEETGSHIMISLETTVFLLNCPLDREIVNIICIVMML